MKRRQFNGLWCVLLAAQAGCARGQEIDEPVGVTITGLDHLAEHLSIQNFWVNGTGGHPAAKGGSTVCCASIASPLRPNATVLQGKRPWEDLARRPDASLFAEVANPMKD